MTAKTTETKKTAKKSTKPDASAEAFWADGFETVKEQWSKMLGEDNQIAEFHKENYDSIVESVSAVNDSFEKIANESVAFHQKAFEDGVAIANQTLGASSVQDALEIQGQYAKTAVEAYTAYVNKLGEMWSEGARASFQPFSGRTQNLFQGIPGLRG